MEQVTIQNQTSGLVSARSQFYGQMQEGGFGGLAGDPFLLIIQQMVEGMLSEEGETQMQGMPVAEETVEEGDTLELLQSFAAMLHANPDWITQLTPEQLEVLQAQGGMLESTNVAMPMAQTQVAQANPLAVDLKAVQAATQPLTEAAANQAVFAANPENVAAKPEQKNIEFTIVPPSLATEATAGESELDFITLARQFSSAVDTAKKQMQQQDQTQKEIPVVNEIAVAKSEQPTIMDITAKKAEYTMQNPQLADQVKTGITTHLAKGDSEFTMKLYPEELGEITVKMLKTGGKLSIQIVTASAQTSHLLNQDLAALREAVRPMQAEVHQVVSIESENAQMQQFNMSNQQFANQQNRAFEQQKTPGYYNNNSLAEEEVQQEVPEQRDDTNLNIYI